jgi:two-component system, cell cycle sensor histidine kinase and response regulator CckA
MNIATFVLVVWFAARSLNISAATLQAANDSLAVSEEHLRMATGGGGIGIWNWNLLTGEMQNSPLCREICGLPLTSDVAIDETLSRVHPDDRPMVDSHINKALQTNGALDVECRMVWPDDGSVHWVASKGKVFTDSSGRAVRMEGIVQEITTRKFAETQTKLLAAIVESSQDAIYAKDLAGNVTSWNPAAEQIFGYTAAEIVGQPVRLLAVPGKESEFADVLHRVSHGETIHQFETQRRAKNGKILDVSLTVSPLRDAHGSIVGLSSIARDVTDLHVVERQLRQAQKMEAVGQLAGGVAHDFNNLIMVVNSYAQMILDHRGAVPDVRQQAERILQAGEKAASVTRQLLAFSRKQMQDLKVVDLNDLVRNFCKLLPRVLGEDVAIVVETKPEVILVKADQGQVEQILMNLAVNARDAMPVGGKLTIALQNLAIDADYCLQHGLGVYSGNYAAISVRDSGLGMDSETKARIFEPFFTTKEIGKGTGLGLATVYGIVKQHKGMIWVYSEPGLGTEFKIYFPLCESRSAAEALPAVRANVEGGSETILLVEDEDSLREVLENYLTSKGYRVLAAENGHLAIRLGENYPRQIDLLLTDFIMPGMRGPQVAAEVLKTNPQAAVIFMSGYVDRDLKAESAQFKHSFLQKPLSLRTLAEQIRLALTSTAQRVS